ncbi:hypothetical protein PM032_00555 [Halorubrum ezzemoulense]|uniref:hypothetical protein n=1 Tax=Halorubrum ezzemoulense TaxID=337243 RepID=UPI0023303736|nr:hypothetical protein [Halorubrum ezzemoulense]MDB2269510.1 hypothetical protein [Halorubrum ezzemoulense]
MSELGDDTQAAMCYPSGQQYQQWKKWADERGYNSVSRFMIDMIEAGSKQIDFSVAYDDEPRELRHQRNDLKQELDEARRRIDRLESQLYQGERQAIVDFLEERTEGATFGEIVQHLVDDAPARVAGQLDRMEGEDVLIEGSKYVYLDQDNES